MGPKKNCHLSSLNVNDRLTKWEYMSMHGVRDCLNTSDADSLRRCRRPTQTMTETRPRQILHKYTKNEYLWTNKTWQTYLKWEGWERFQITILNKFLTHFLVLRGHQKNRNALSYTHRKKVSCAKKVCLNKPSRPH